jgi:phosphodiesterase/alkaline phosphatase D-like protein
VGEVTDSSAIVWTRLTRRETRNPADAPMVDFVYDDESARDRNRANRRIIGIKYPDGFDVNHC